MYERYAGLILIWMAQSLDTEPTHRKAWREVLGHYGLQYDVQAMIALNGSPTWRIAQAIIELNQ
ncbi:HAD-superfamily protein hydrolase, partial [Escherichia coli H120]